MAKESQIAQWYHSGATTAHLARKSYGRFLAPLRGDTIATIGGGYQVGAEGVHIIAQKSGLFNNVYAFSAWTTLAHE